MSNSREITGTGHLLNNKDGVLKLTLINKIQFPKEDNTFFEAILEDQHQIRTLRSITDYCYKLLGRDEYGYEYICESVDIGKQYNRAVYTCFFKSNLFIRSKNVDSLKIMVSLMFKNQYNFATNVSRAHNSEIPYFPDYSLAWGKAWNFKVDNLNFNLHKDLKFLQLDVISEGADLDDNSLKLIINSLNFVMGDEHLFYFQVKWDSQNEFEIEINSSVKLPKTSIFTPPYLRDGSYGDEEKENVKLFEAYYRFLKLNPDNILTKWHKRMVNASNSYYYIYGLLVAIAIESLLKKYYPKEEKDVAIKPRDVQREISSLGEELDDKKLRERIITACSQLRKPDYIPKKMLQQLEVEGIISNGSSKSWDRLRNKYSHGNDDNNEMKYAYSLISCCLNTYYELIFNIIKYSGYYINYSIKHGSERRHYSLTLPSS